MPDLKQDLSIKETFHKARDAEPSRTSQDDRKPSPELTLRPKGPTLGPMANQVDMGVQENKEMQEYLDKLKKRLPELEKKPKKQIDLKKDFDRSR